MVYSSESAVVTPEFRQTLNVISDRSPFIGGGL